MGIWIFFIIPCNKLAFHSYSRDLSYTANRWNTSYSGCSSAFSLYYNPLETIAASASISKSGALHIFQTGIHCSPVAYLIQYRLAQAAEQLYITQKSVSSIAEETGFTSSGYFCRKFRQYYHMSPNEYRKKKTEEIS